MVRSITPNRFLMTFCIAVSVWLAGCATSDATLRQGGHSEAYIQGFHDGRHSGMKEAGNYLEHVVKDHRRFESDADYRTGWLDGEDEGMRMQQEANAATGNASAYRMEREIDRSRPDAEAIGHDAMQGIDPATLRVLEQK